MDTIKARAKRLLARETIPKWRVADLARATNLNYWTLRRWIETPKARLTADYLGRVATILDDLKVE